MAVPTPQPDDTKSNFGRFAGVMTRVIGAFLGLNMNSTADQAIDIASLNYAVRRITLTNPSTALTLSQGGIYTASNKGGTAIVPASQTYAALVNPTDYLDLTIVPTRFFSVAQLFFSLTNAQGAPATADVYILGDALDL